MVFFININLYAQNNGQNSGQVYDITIISKGQGSILCNEQFKVDNDDRKEFTLKNNADVRLVFSPNKGCKLSKFTINGIIKGQDIENNQITLKGISRKTVIVATFESKENAEDSVKLTIVSGAGGVINYKGESIDNTKKTTYVKKGTKINLKCKPQKGFELEKLSVNGILRDVVDNTCSFEILRNTVVNAVFKASSPVNPNNQVTINEKPKFLIKVSGPGEAALSGEINGVVAGNPEDPFSTNREVFYVTNGSDVTIKLTPVHNIKSFVIESKDLTKTIKSSNGIYTTGVMHDYPEIGMTSVSVEFTQRYLVEISTNEYGKYEVLDDLKEYEIPNCYIIDEGGKGRLRFAANQHCHLKKLTVNGMDMTNKVNPSFTVVASGGPTYDFDLGSVKKDYKIVATFAPNPLVEISTNEYGKYEVLGDLKEYGTPNCYIIDKGGKGRLRFAANQHCHLKKLIVNGMDMTNKVNPSSTVVTSGGPTYDFDLGSVEKDVKIVATFAPDPMLTITCGQYGNVYRARDTKDLNSSDYYINSGYSKTFYDPSATNNSKSYGKEWILRMVAQEGYNLSKIVINGVDMTSRVIRYSSNNQGNNRKIGFISLGLIKNDTRVEISFKKSIQQTQEVEWVDLGTGVKWATRNVGAKKSTDPGNYYTWKEAKAEIVKIPEGRLPTYDEVDRLLKECSYDFEPVDGVNGIRIFHKSNRRVFIFIPAAGLYAQYDNPEKLVMKGEEGAIWTSIQTGTAKKMGEAMKERSMNPIWLIIGDAISSEGYDRAALALSSKEKVAKVIDADIGARINVRLVLDK